MELEDLKVYQLAMEVGDEAWDIVDKWDYFKKDTIGKQLVKAADSIAANISEGYGRFHYRDSKNFNYYSRSSLYETKTWLKKSYRRGLMEENTYNKLIETLNELGKMLNAYVKTIGRNRVNNSK